MKTNKLFSDEETKDSTATAIHVTDSRIVRMSKLFAKATTLNADSATIMSAYQKGAIDMLDPVIKALCKECPNKGECLNKDLSDECEMYSEIKDVFKK